MAADPKKTTGVSGLDTLGLSLLGSLYQASTTGFLTPTLLQQPFTKQREYFLNKRIDLDGIFFQECRFDGCILYTETGDVHLKDCVIGVGTTLQLGNRLITVAKLLALFSTFPANWLPTIRPIGNGIYTVSIP